MKTRISTLRTAPTAGTDSRVDEQVMKVGATVIGLVSCAIGLWSVASLVGGMVASGGPLALLGNLFTAIVG